MSQGFLHITERLCSLHMERNEESQHDLLKVTFHGAGVEVWGVTWLADSLSTHRGWPAGPGWAPPAVGLREVLAGVMGFEQF